MQLGLAAMCNARPRRFPFCADYDSSIATLHDIRRNVVQRWRTSSDAGAQIETRVMPWTTDRMANYEAFRQRAAVMRAARCDREYIVATPYHENRLTVRVADQRGTIF
jgi:hypothetical protein